jgi:hypothetical protein
MKGTATMEAWIPVVLSVIGSGGILMFILNGIGKWIARRQEQAAAKELAYLQKIEAQQKQIFDIQQERIAEKIKEREAAADSAKALAEMAVLLKSMQAALTKGQTP